MHTHMKTHILYSKIYIYLLFLLIIITIKYLFIFNLYLFFEIIYIHSSHMGTGCGSVVKLARTEKTHDLKSFVWRPESRELTF